MGHSDEAALPQLRPSSVARRAVLDLPVSRMRRARGAAMTYQDPRYRDPEYAARWREAHPDVVRERTRRYLDTPEHREANRLRASRHYYANREDRKAKVRTYYASHRDQQRLTAIARKFGLSPDDYRAMFAAQDGLCAICLTDGRLAVDHDHATGRVRGLVCGTCNFMLGHGKDDPGLLRKAADYLEATR